MVNAVTGYSTSKDYRNGLGLFEGSEVSGMTLASAYLEGSYPLLSGFAAIGRVNGTKTTTLGSGSINTLGEFIQDVVAVTPSTGLLVSSHHWFWYNSGPKNSVKDVTPKTTGSCKFYKAFEYNKQVLVVGVCQETSGYQERSNKPPVQLCTTTTKLYYADCTNGWPTQIKTLNADSVLGCSSSTREGRAVAAGSDFITIVGGGQSDKTASIVSFLK